MGCHHRLCHRAARGRDRQGEVWRVADRLGDQRRGGGSAHAQGGDFGADGFDGTCPLANPKATQPRQYRRGWSGARKQCSSQAQAKAGQEAQQAPVQFHRNNRIRRNGQHEPGREHEPLDILTLCASILSLNSIYFQQFFSLRGLTILET